MYVYINIGPDKGSYLSNNKNNIKITVLLRNTKGLKRALAHSICIKQESPMFPNIRLIERTRITYGFQEFII